MATAPTIIKKAYRMDVVCTCGGDARLVGLIDGGKNTIGYMCIICHKFFTKRQAKQLNLQRKYLTR